MSDDMPLSYARAVGDRLRNLRRQQSLSLLAVEEASGREFKASVLGAYERGERIISVLRLQRLAQLYGVPVDQLLPRPASPGSRPRQPSVEQRPAAGRHRSRSPSICSAWPPSTHPRRTSSAAT